jgi:hypothetical protein
LQILSTKANTKAYKVLGVVLVMVLFWFWIISGTERLFMIWKVVDLKYTRRVVNAYASNFYPKRLKIL